MKKRNKVLGSSRTKTTHLEQARGGGPGAKGALQEKNCLETGFRQFFRWRAFIGTCKTELCKRRMLKIRDNTRAEAKSPCSLPLFHTKEGGDRDQVRAADQRNKQLPKKSRTPDTPHNSMPGRKEKKGMEQITRALQGRGRDINKPGGDSKNIVVGCREVTKKDSVKRR